MQSIVRSIVIIKDDFTVDVYRIMGNFGVVKFWRNSPNTLVVNLIFGDVYEFGDFYFGG